MFSSVFPLSLSSSRLCLWTAIIIVNAFVVFLFAFVHRVHFCCRRCPRRSFRHSQTVQHAIQPVFERAQLSQLRGEKLRQEQAFVESFLSSLLSSVVVVVLLVLHATHRSRARRQQRRRRCSDAVVVRRERRIHLLQERDERRFSRLDSGENGSRRRSALCGVRRRRPRKRTPALVRRHGSQHQGLEMVVGIVVHSVVGAHPKTTCWIPFVREWGGGSL